MIQPGPDDKIYPVVKIAMIVNALAAEGVRTEDALAGVRLSESEISSPATRVSLNEALQCYHNAVELSHDPFFAFHAGLRFHVSSYGMYGFAILSSTNFRQTMRFAVKYHQLATPLTEISFKEQDGVGILLFTTLPHPRVDARLFRFLVEMQFGVCLSLNRDIMGPSFMARELHCTYRTPTGASNYSKMFGCPVLFDQPDNGFVFDSSWLDETPKLGNEITYKEIVGLCDSLIEEFELRIGLVGKVRQLLLVNLLRPSSFDDVAKRLNMSTRTLRRKLRDENTSFRKVLDELRRDMAIKYLRDTDLTIEDVSHAMGFSEVTGFRHAFRRWTKATPHHFRAISADRGRSRL
jgi:AraC-like DNA-binding protein